MDSIKDKIIAAIKSDNFFDVVCEEYLEDRKDEKVLGNIIAELHNQGTIDFLSLFRTLEKSDESQNLYNLIRIFADTLPEINDTTSNSLKTITHLLKLEANSYLLWESFDSFCRKDKTRPNELLNISLDDVDPDVDCLSKAIKIGVIFDPVYYTSKAIELIGSSEQLICQRALYSLGQINLSGNVEKLKLAISTILNRVLGSESDILLSTGLRALFNLTRQNEGIKTKLIAFLNLHIAQDGKKFIQVASSILFLNGGEISEIECDLLLAICKNYKTEDLQTIDNLDYALMNFVKNNQFSKASDFLDSFFSNTNYSVSISDFDDFSRELLKHNETHLSSIVTKWLLSKKSIYGRYCLDVLNMVSGEEVPLTVDEIQLSPCDNSLRIFLARKVCGWFYYRPISAVSFMLSLLKGSSEAETQEIVRLIFNPLLISYSGKVKDYLKEVEGEYGVVSSDLLKKLDEYHIGLDRTKGIRELDVPISHREAFHRKRTEEMAKSYEAADKGGLMSILGVKKNIILYGAGSIYYMYRSSDEEPVRQETLMQSISTKIEYPSLSVVDPHGLDYLLQHFRLEGCVT